jgi:hypothetical protein
VTENKDESTIKVWKGIEEENKFWEELSLDFLLIRHGWCTKGSCQ